MSISKDLILPNKYLKNIASQNQNISPIQISDLDLFMDFFTKDPISYGNTWSYIVQSTYGLGENGLGYKYFDQNNLATLAIYPHMEDEDTLILYWVRPMGKDILNIINTLSKNFSKKYKVRSYVKKLHESQYNQLKKLGWKDIKKYPWHSQAEAEDDTYPELILDTKKTLDIAKNATRKEELRRTYVRTETRKERFNIEFSSKNFNDIAWNVTKKFFANYDEFADKKLLSAKEDYKNMIYNNPERNNLNKVLIYVNKEPLGYYITESINNYTNIVAHIALRSDIKYLVDLSTFHALENIDTKYVNLGGAEDKGIYHFNKKYKPVKQNKMYWVTNY